MQGKILLTEAVLNKRIVISGGGTGGHLYPGLALADEFRRREAEILYVGSKRGLEAEVVPREGYKFLSVPSRGIVGAPLKKLAALLQLGLGTLKAAYHMSNWKPDLVIGTGGYVSVPAVVAGKLLGVPVVLLEQNAVPGRATQLLSRMARVVCLSFEASAKFFGKRPTEWTGNPLRQTIALKDKFEAREALGLVADRPTLLVAGASQGATSINRALVEALPTWADKEWNIVHLTGRNHLARVKARVGTLLPEGTKLCYRVFGFRQDMENLYSAADLVVSRAGATTIAELTSLGLPSLLVPYPYAGAHQKENARVLVDSGGAEEILDELVGEKLRDEVDRLLPDMAALAQMSENSRRAARPDALERVLDACHRAMN